MYIFTYTYVVTQIVAVVLTQASDLKDYDILSTK